MSGDTVTRVALGAAIGLGVALAAAIALTGTRDQAGSDGATTRPVVQSAGATLSVADAQVLAQTRPWIRDWNVASDAWVQALAAGRERFLPRYQGYTGRMNLNSLRIRLSASKVENPRLRTLLQRLGDVYREQFRAVVDVNGAVLAEDQERASAGIARLERADDDKIRAATALIDAFPELGGDLSRLK